tara:strand:- start:231 stop:410 length:180 start_codon:yes stop_codon:yes gene_type:complete
VGSNPTFSATLVLGEKMRFVLPILALAFMAGCGDKDEDSAATTDSDAVDCIKDKSDCDQ